MDIDNMFVDYASSTLIVTTCQYISRSKFHARVDDRNNRIMPQKIE